MEKQFGREVGEVIRKLHAENGTVFRLGRTVERFHGDDKVQGVELDDGERLLADLVVVGLGITPVTEFLQGAPVNDDRSVDVDSRLMLAEKRLRPPATWPAIRILSATIASALSIGD